MAEKFGINESNEVTRVFIVRHGQTDHNVAKILQGHLDTSLNSVGREQAESVAQSLKHLKIDAIYSSDLKRCRETTKYIHDAIDQESLPVIYTDALRERHMGIIEGMQINDAIEFAKKDGKTYRDYGENSKEFVDRIQKMLNHNLSENKSNKNILWVSHGGTIRTILKILKYDRDLIVYNTSVTIIDFDKHAYNKFEIKVIGDVSHLGKGDFVIKDTRVR